MAKNIPRAIPQDVQRLRKKDFLIPSEGPFRVGRLADVVGIAHRESIIAADAELTIRDKDGNAVAAVTRSRKSKVNQELLIRGANAVLNVAKKLRQDPILVAKLLEDGEVITSALTTAFDGMQSVVSYMGELREYFPDISLDQVPKEELQVAIDIIKQKRKNPDKQ